MTGQSGLNAVAVVGAGTMGQGIAQLCAQAGWPTLLYDVAEGAATRAREAIGESLARRVARGKLGEAEAESILENIEIAVELADLAPAKVVIEAIVERLEIKRALFDALEMHCSPQALLCTNTSSLGVGEIAKGARRPERIAGLHFFNPAPVMRLVEVVRAELTSAETCERLTSFVEGLGKHPVVALDSPGFIVNRCARPYYGEALRMLEERVATEAEIDACLTDGAGFPLGPFALMDLVGLDIGLGATRTIWEALGRPARFLPSPLLVEKVEAGKLGRKSGEGFYRYPREAQAPRECKRPQASVDALAALLNQAGGAHCLVSEGETAQAVASRTGQPVVVLDAMPSPATDRGPLNLAYAAHGVAQETLTHWQALAEDAGFRLVAVRDAPGLIVARMVMMLADEAQRVESEGVAGAAQIDTAMCLGLNLATGPMSLRDRLGRQRLQAVRRALASLPEGERYADE
ncbi:3-hydroxyacyl-CoA dehydrogenase NAD-binding domain-containing protein [Halomonas urumqiensis]|uniref:3-hydroxyacyl-CoA dehydrogenase n=1 Tax=Halomonas urumqiensis TaxID=1684789 RepID=A0A2N7UCH9_9GAMM|nr:3-hydroxyacyl-CoA dehydrogenase NAD-binding domain-containing protein [Halomonas urumqiensis]PMR78101.1 3-hydroxyacyl-CoA dehydrogenase [Halomonas urumqiensis]PTB03252.1 3-hydroxyacyl-CoA dehydrogenase [Halomonas urumqiensis]GHE20593.1 3-hydroxyacyl-CoA dehydrogenase PaaC [Halomonas urumqiensis]